MQLGDSSVILCSLIDGVQKKSMTPKRVIASRIPNLAAGEQRGRETHIGAGFSRTCPLFDYTQRERMKGKHVVSRPALVFTRFGSVPMSLCRENETRILYSSLNGKKCIHALDAPCVDGSQLKDPSRLRREKRHQRKVAGCAGSLFAAAIVAATNCAICE